MHRNRVKSEPGVQHSTSTNQISCQSSPHANTGKQTSNDCDGNNCELLFIAIFTVEWILKQTIFVFLNTFKLPSM